MMGVTWRKGISLTWLFIASMLPFTFLYYYFAPSILVIALSYGAVFSISALKEYLQAKMNPCFSNSAYRKLNMQDPAENRLQQLLIRLTRKAQIPLPEVMVELPSEQPKISVCVQGWPHPKQICISQGFIDVSKKGFSQRSIAALLAHELSHLKHRDAVALFMAKCLLNINGVLFIFFLFLFQIPQMIIAGLLMISGILANALLHRTQETLADIGSVDITSQPRAMIRALYDQFLQYLHWGMIVLENNFAAKYELPVQSKQKKATLKKIYYQLPALSAKEVYDHFKGSCGREGYTPFYLRLQPWLNTHPALEDRVAVLQHKFGILKV